MDYATDDERVEEIKKWWKENGKSLVVGVVLGLSILFGWKAWKDYRVTQGMNASAVYAQLSAALNQGNDKLAQGQLDDLVKNYSSTPYAVMASMAVAKHKVDKKDLAGARTHLQWAHDHAGDDETRHLARLRLARVILALGDAAAALQLVSNVNAGEFASSYEELKGDIYIKQGKTAEAYAAYKKAQASAAKSGQGNPTLQLKLEGLSAGTQESRS